MQSRIWTVILSSLTLVALTACAEAASAGLGGPTSLMDDESSTFESVAAPDLSALEKDLPQVGAGADPEEMLSSELEEDLSLTGSEPDSVQEFEDNEFLGLVQSMADGLWQVGDRTFLVTPSTQIELGVDLGSTIEVKYIVNPDGSFTAISIELEDEADEQEVETEIEDGMHSDDSANEAEQHDQQHDEHDDEGSSADGGSHSD